MRRKTVVVLAAATMASMVLITGCGDKTADTGAATTSNASSVEAGAEAETETAEFYDPVGEYQHNENSAYQIVVNGETKDVTKYVTECENGFCKFQSDILMEAFGYTEKSTDEEFLTYSKEGKTLQLAIGGHDIIVNGTVSKVGNPMEQIKDSDQLIIPADFMLCLGEYTSYSVSVSPDGTALVYEPIAEAPMMETEASVEAENTAEDAEAPVEDGETAAMEDLVPAKQAEDQMQEETDAEPESEI